MELSGLECRGCGSTDVTYIPVGRILKCNQCGKQETYSRATLNTHEKVTSCRKNAISFFKAGEYENAKRYALDVLNIFIDNAPSLFIIEYYNEFTLRKPGSIKNFFNKIKDIALEYDEIQDMQEIIIGTANNLCDFEEEIIRFMALNLQAEEDAENLCDFVDKLCPYFISKRPSINFLTEELAEYYYDLAGHCNIPKTCFALLKSIEDNPDSPYYSGFAGDVVGKCPECGNDVIRGKYGYGCSNYKNGCKFRIGGIICKRVITPNHAKQLLTDGRTQKIEGFLSKNGKPFSAVLKMEENKVVFDFV
mgnify:CR=1 FL=1